MRVGHAALGVDAGAIWRARPAADDDLLVAAGLPHHLAELEAAVVVGDDVDDLAVFEVGDELLEEGLVRDARDADDDELRALDGFGDAVGGKRELGLAPALETVLGLGTGQLGANGHAGLVHVAERALEEWVEVADAHLLAGKCAICCAGLANCTTAEHGDRRVAQLLNIDGHRFLLLFHAGCSCALWQMFRHDYVGPRSNCSSAYLVAGHRYYEMMEYQAHYLRAKA